MKSAIVAMIGLAGLASAAFGQHGFNIVVTYGGGGTSVNPAFPVARIRVEAVRPETDYAIAGVRFDVLAGEGDWVNDANWRVLPPLTTGSNRGTLAQPNITGVVAGQLNFPQAFIFADPARPIGAWEADWTTANFTTRDVSLSTRTLRFDCYPLRSSPASTSRLAGLVEGSGVIHVTPAPSALALLGLGGLVAGRRRR